MRNEKNISDKDWKTRDLRFQGVRFILNPEWTEIERLLEEKNFLMKKLTKEDKLMEALEIERKYNAELDYYDILDGLILPFEYIYSMFVWFSELDKKDRIDMFEFFESFNFLDGCNIHSKNMLKSLDKTKAKYLGYLLKTYYKKELDEKYNEFIEKEDYEALIVLKKYSLDLSSIPVKE